MKNTLTALALGLLVVTACSSTGKNSATPISQITSLPPTTAEVKIFPTPSSPGDRIIWDNLEVTMDQVEITQEYVTDFGSKRLPPAGTKLLWVHVQLKNAGLVEMNIPLLENFSVLYAAMELKPTYGHRAEYADYETLGDIISPAQELDGWLRFDIPVAAELRDLRFVFLPESNQVGASYGSPNYPYIENKPTYVWECEKR